MEPQVYLFMLICQRCCASVLSVGDRKDIWPPKARRTNPKSFSLGWPCL